MSKVTSLLKLTKKHLNAIQNDAAEWREDIIADHSRRFDEIIGMIVTDFDPKNLQEAPLCVAVAMLCLRNNRIGGFKTLQASHSRCAHFRKFHDQYGEYILSWDDKDPCDITKRVRILLDSNQHHAEITSYSMDEELIKAA